MSFFPYPLLNTNVSNNNVEIAPTVTLIIPELMQMSNDVEISIHSKKIFSFELAASMLIALTLSQIGLAAMTTENPTSNDEDQCSRTIKIMIFIDCLIIARVWMNVVASAILKREWLNHLPAIVQPKKVRLFLTYREVSPFLAIAVGSWSGTWLMSTECAHKKSLEGAFKLSIFMSLFEAIRSGVALGLLLLGLITAGNSSYTNDHGNVRVPIIISLLYKLRVIDLIPIETEEEAADMQQGPLRAGRARMLAARSAEAHNRAIAEEITVSLPVYIYKTPVTEEGARLLPSSLDASPKSVNSAASREENGPRTTGNPLIIHEVPTARSLILDDSRGASSGSSSSSYSCDSSSGSALSGHSHASPPSLSFGQGASSAESESSLHVGNENILEETMETRLGSAHARQRVSEATSEGGVEGANRCTKCRKIMNGGDQFGRTNGHQESHRGFGESFSRVRRSLSSLVHSQGSQSPKSNSSSSPRHADSITRPFEGESNTRTPLLVHDAHTGEAHTERDDASVDDDDRSISIQLEEDNFNTQNETTKKELSNDLNRYYKQVSGEQTSETTIAIGVPPSSTNSVSRNRPLLRTTEKISQSKPAFLSPSSVSSSSSSSSSNSSYSFGNSGGNDNMDDASNSCSCLKSEGENADFRKNRKSKHKSKVKKPMCLICWRRYKEGAEVVILPCERMRNEGAMINERIENPDFSDPTLGHHFHKKCLGMWVVVRRSCPICRQRLLPPSVSVPASISFSGFTAVGAPLNEGNDLSRTVVSVDMNGTITFQSIGALENSDEQIFSNED